MRQILLVEDNGADVELVREALQEHEVRCELIVVDNGERAVELIDEIDAGGQRRPDLVILDLNLPKRPGKEVLKRMRASSICGNVPVVILTSSGSQKDKDAVAQFSPSRFVTKPSALDDFLRLGAVFRQILYPTQ